MLYQRPLTVVSDCIRGMLCAAPGNTLFSADFSAVEARGLAWLAGQEDVIRAFRDGVDIYNHAASGIFGRPIDRKKHLVEGQIGKVRGSEERRVGKECVRTCRSRWAPYH